MADDAEAIADIAALADQSGAAWTDRLAGDGVAGDARRRRGPAGPPAPRAGRGAAAGLAGPGGRESGRSLPPARPDLQELCRAL
jgi:hypothetical protein